jgi:hypothetical protein
MTSAVVALDAALASVRGDPRCRLHGIVRAPAGRRDHHGCLQRVAGVLAVHRAAVNQPTAIRLALGDRYAQPTGPQVRRETTAIAGWPDYDAGVALPDPQNRPHSRRTQHGPALGGLPGRAIALGDGSSVSGAHAEPLLGAPSGPSAVTDALARASERRHHGSFGPGNLSGACVIRNAARR